MLPSPPPPLDNRILPTFLCVRRPRYLFAPPAGAAVRHRHGGGHGRGRPAGTYQISTAVRHSSPPSSLARPYGSRVSRKHVIHKPDMFNDVSRVLHTCFIDGNGMGSCGPEPGSAWIVRKFGAADFLIVASLTMLLPVGDLRIEINYRQGCRQNFFSFFGRL